METKLKPGRMLKAHIIKEYADRFRDSSYMFVTEFKGVTNKDFESLKKKLRPADAAHMVVKNSLCALALQSLKIEGVADAITGSCSITYGKGDPVTASKALVSFAKTNKKMVLKGGYADGAAITAETLKELAAIPSREVLLARLLGALNSPMSGFVSVCSGVIKKLLYAFNEIIKKKESK